MDNIITYLIIAFIITQSHVIMKMFLKIKRNNRVGKFIILLNKIAYNFGLVFRLINTLIHEIGHALASVLTGGKVRRMSLFKDGGGEASTISRTGYSKVLTSLAGYPFASVVSLTLVILLSEGKNNIIMYVLIGIIAASVLLLIRNMFGIVWSLSFLSLLIVMNTFASDELINMFVMFIVSVTVVESLMSAVYIFYLSVYKRYNSGDAKNLAEFTKLPAFLYGAFFISQAFVISCISILIFTKDHLPL